MSPDPIIGDRVFLRPWELADAEWYVGARDDLVFRFTTERRELDVAEVRAAIERTRDDADLATFAICERDGPIVGSLALVFDGGAAEISYFLAEGGRGRGLATEAVALAIAWAAERGVDRVGASVAAGNVGSAAVLERAGFTRAGSAEHAQLGPSTTWTIELGRA